jgi:hypothetical protein
VFVERLISFRISQAILLVGPLTTLVVSPTLNYDAIALPKMVAISSLGYLVLFLILSRYSTFSSKLGRNVVYSATAFFLCMVSTLLFSGAPIFQQFWGSFGRNTGFLTYSSLLFLLLGMALIQEQEFYKRFINVFVLSSIAVVLYCLIQIAGKDPVGWSEKRTFATLGNVNFLSAYLGLVSISALALVLGSGTSRYLRFISLLLIGVALPIMLSTNSIQGVMVFAAGSFLLLGIYGFSLVKNLAMRTLYFMSGGVLFLLTSFALFNKGPLAPLIYQISIQLRGDYMHAGWEMTTLKPFFGVGMDSYGDWYRQARGEITTLRGSAERISNSAHNIFLDISSNGGFPLLISYLAILSIAFYLSVKVLRSTKGYDPIFSAIFATWVGYQIQALISINQSGVGVWGWLFTGALIGYAKSLKNNRLDEIDSDSTKLKKVSSKKLKKSLLPPQVTLLGIAGFLLGLTLSVIPLNADIAYKRASLTMAIEPMFESTKRLGSAAFHRELVLEAALKSNLSEQAGEIALSLVEEYPRDYFGWRVLALISPLGSPERAAAIDRMIALDPFNKESLPPR